MESQNKIEQLKSQLEGFLDRLDNLNPEKTSVEDIDQLIQIIERVEQGLNSK